MTVYFARRRGDPAGAIKIGHSSDVNRRMVNLSVAVPEGVEVLATCAGGPEIEAYLHEMLAEHRIAGEWFRPHEDVLRWVSQAKTSASLRIPIAPDRSPVRLAATALTRRGDLPWNAPDGIARLVADGCVFAVAATLYCLNELLKREYRGRGDTQTAARDRVAIRVGLKPVSVKRIWQRAAGCRDVSADAMFRLHREMIRVLQDEGGPLPEYFAKMSAALERTDREWAAMREAA